MQYEIRILPAALDELDELPLRQQARVNRRIEALGTSRVLQVSIRSLVDGAFIEFGRETIV